MKYINDYGSLGLVQGNKYTVTFEVTKSNFGYDFVIKSIKQYCKKRMTFIVVCFFTWECYLYTT